MSDATICDRGCSSLTGCEGYCIPCPIGASPAEQSALPREAKQPSSNTQKTPKERTSFPGPFPSNTQKNTMGGEE
jgi:hypothetical protein